MTGQPRLESEVRECERLCYNAAAACYAWNSRRVMGECVKNFLIQVKKNSGNVAPVPLYRLLRHV